MPFGSKMRWRNVLLDLESLKLIKIFFLTERSKRKSKESKKKQNEPRKKTKENIRDTQVVFPMETFN